jgi:hypothetical protein
MATLFSTFRIDVPAAPDVMSTWLPIWPINEDMMKELVLANRATNWQKLKSLVLDSVSCPITKRRLQSRAGRIFRVAWPAAAPRLQQGDRERVARGTRSSRPWFCLDQCADHRRQNAQGFVYLCRSAAVNNTFLTGRRPAPELEWNQPEARSSDDGTLVRHVAIYESTGIHIR